MFEAKCFGFQHDSNARALSDTLVLPFTTLYIENVEVSLTADSTLSWYYGVVNWG